MATPSQPQVTWPCSLSWTMTCSAIFEGTANPIPDRAARRRVNCGINADHLPVKIEGRSAGVAAVDRSVDLQEIVVKALVDVTPECGDDPGGHRAAEPERIAHRDYPIPDLGVIAVFPCHVGKLLVGIDLEKGDVGLLVAADHFGSVAAVILKEDRHLVGGWRRHGCWLQCSRRGR